MTASSAVAVSSPSVQPDEPSGIGPATAGPSAAQLLADATELRDIAARLRAAAQASAELLDRVLRLDVPETWVGPWAQTCGETIQRWQLEADVSATELTDRARALDAHADDLEQRSGAGTPRSVR